MKGRIWILEDDASICGLVKVALEMNGLELQAFSTISSFEEALEKDAPDVALLDIMLPDGSGLDVLKFVKSRHPSVAVIMLTAKGREEDKVTGLNMGADDYVTKPFSILELTARVNARLRGKEQRGEIAAKGVIIDLDRMSATLDGEPMVLNKKEYELLKYFVENAGKALPREKILTDVWGYDQGETRTLDNHVARLRKMGVKIETVFGVGYRF
ncbi:MAG: response regulator transcription factor [Clostridia bacterium]|nr:response regulator transcription factor [Clostridia bacterium]